MSASVRVGGILTDAFRRNTGPGTGPAYCVASSLSHAYRQTVGTSEQTDLREVRAGYTHSCALFDFPLIQQTVGARGQTDLRKVRAGYICA